MSGQDTVRSARDALAGGDAEQALSLAREALDATPHDPVALEVAAAAAIETLDEDAVALARRLVEVVGDGAAHRLLGLALLTDGDVAGAETALRAALVIDPHDTAAVVSLGHLLRRHGDSREAIELLEQAVAEDPGNVGILRNLIDVHRLAGRARQAITWAERLVQAAPEDRLALLELAELSLELNEHDAAAEVFGRLHAVDTEPGHRIFPLHGMIEAQIRAGHLRPALDLAVTATSVDREPLTTDALAYIVTEVFGQGDRPAPSREALMKAFAAERARYRRALDQSGVI